MRIIICFFVSCGCFATEIKSWINQVSTRTDQETIEWLKREMKIDFPHIDHEKPKILDHPCEICYLGKVSHIEPKIYVFMSFSIPEEAWLSLSRELEKQQGTFVIRGLPNNSFQEFAKRIVHLKKKGLNVDIQINPSLFKQFDVKEVPTFATSLGIVRGNISLNYALHLIDQEKIQQNLPSQTNKEKK